MENVTTQTPTQMQSQSQVNNASLTPSKPYQLASVVLLIAGIACYGIGLINADMLLNEKGYYLIVLLYGLFSAVSLQKHIRDEAEDAEGNSSSKVYSKLCWLSCAISIALLLLGLYNAELYLSEKGFYGIAYVLTLYAGITVQKNLRDQRYIEAAID